MLEYLKHRRLRFDILTIFLSIFAVSFAFVIILTYQKNSESILKFSRGEMERISQLITAKVDELVQDVQFIPKITKGILENLEHPSLNNPELSTFMLDTVKNYERMYAFYIAKADGTYMEVINMGLNKQAHYVSHPEKPLPPDALFSFTFIDRTLQPPVNFWWYKNKDLKTVAEEQTPVTFDPRTRPWYIGAKTKGSLYWTDVYEFKNPGSPTSGITVADPVFSPSGELTYVIGLDLSITFLESFLENQKVGNTGEAFILSSDGQLAIPKVIKVKNRIDQKIVAAAFENYTKNRKENFTFKTEGVKYLAYIKPFPVQFGKEWLVTIIVPLNDLFAEMIRSQIMITGISLLILIFGVLVVIYFSKKISTPIVTLAGEIDKIRQLDLGSKVRVHSNIKEIQMMDTAISAMRSALGSFGRYVPKEIVKQLILKGDVIALGGEKKEITVLFSDIAGFTSIAETVPTDVLISLLTDYFAPLSKIILENGGTIDKYIGDSIMAFWNAPLDVEGHPAKACLAALLCQYHLRLLNQKAQAENRPLLSTRIGINTGKAFIGNIGTLDRMNYTAIGDVVNIAQRLEQSGKEYHVPIIISDDVYQKVRGQFLVRPLDRVAVKGRKEKIKIYELVAKTEGMREILATPAQILLCREFTEAYEAFEKEDHGKAGTLFKALQEQFPEDYPIQIYLQRLVNQPLK